MPYVITDACVGTKDASCVEVCPVDCIHPVPGTPEFETADQLFIDPTECIDCDACASACPVDAPTPDDLLPASAQKFVDLNREYFTERP